MLRSTLRFRRYRCVARRGSSKVVTPRTRIPAHHRPEAMNSRLMITAIHMATVWPRAMASAMIRRSPSSISASIRPPRRVDSPFRSQRTLLKWANRSHEGIAPGLVQLSELAGAGDEFVRGAVLDDPAGLHDEDPVGDLDGRQAVGDDDRGPALEHR